MSIRDMVARHSDYKETKDLIPTPPYATRAFFEYVAPRIKTYANESSAWDPACGFGHMCDVFKEYGFKDVIGSDIKDYGYPNTKILDINDAHSVEADVIVTNPPYALMDQFIKRGLSQSNKDFALLTRIQVLEGQRRYSNFYNVVPPTSVHVFSDRVPFKTGKVVRKAPKMFTHVWVYWDITNIRKYGPSDTTFSWIPPTVQKQLEKDGDYDDSDDN